MEVQKCYVGFTKSTKSHKGVILSLSGKHLDICKSKLNERGWIKIYITKMDNPDKFGNDYLASILPSNPPGDNQQQAQDGNSTQGHRYSEQDRPSTPSLLPDNNNGQAERKDDVPF